MSRIEKLKQALRTCKGPFPYRDLVTLLQGIGYVDKSMGGGSGRKFVHADTLHVIRFHEPHPGTEIKPYLVRQLREVLEERGHL